MTTAIGNQTLYQVPAIAYNITAIYLVFVCTVSCLLNSVAAYVIGFKDKCSSAQAVLIFSLTASNALFTLATTPLTIHANCKHEWEAGSAACSYYAFMTFCGGLSSISHLLLLSVERYIAVVHPFQANTLLQHSHVYIGIVLSWLVTFTIASLPLFGWSRYQIEGIRTSCSVEIFPTSMNGISYNIFIFIIGYAVPISIITYMNTRFLQEVKRLINRGKRNGDGAGKQDYAMRKREDALMKQMCLQVVALVTSFNISWLPYAIVMFIGTIRGKPFENPQISSIPSYFAKSYTLYDPIIFFVVNKKYRSMLKQCIFKTEASRAINIELKLLKN